jgi:hypothetical protein
VRFDYHGLNCHQVAMADAYLRERPHRDDVTVCVGTAIGPDGERRPHTWVEVGQGVVMMGGVTRSVVIDHFGWESHSVNFVTPLDEQCARDAIHYMLQEGVAWPPPPA